VRARDLNWFQLEEYLRRDDRIVLPIGSTEQHAYLSLETDNILAERVAAEAGGDGQYGGFYELPDEDVLRVWATGVEETRAILEHGWRT
jgi:Creatinine amidohydrolase